MTWNYAYTPHIWPSILTLLLLIALAIYAWRRRSVPGVVPFIIGCLLAVPWVAGSVLELAALNPATKIFWFKFQSVWQLPSATASTCFILEYAWPGRWLTRRNLAVLSIAPLLLVILVLTNNLHHLAWSGFTYDGSVIPLRGPGIWSLIAYGYGLGVLNLIVLVWLLLRSPQHSWPVAIMVAGQIGMRVIYLLEKTYLVRFNLPLDIIGLAFVDLMYAIALFGFRIFDPIPLARQMAIEQLHDGMLVLDPRGRVTSLNPAAERILHVTAKQVKGKPVQEILPGCPEGPLADPAGIEMELSLPEVRRDGVGAGQEIRYYSLETSLLKDFRGLEVGRLLVLHDVTSQKQAQAQQAQLLWAQATLQEREQLAGELHDGLSQNLAFLNLQAQAAQLYLQSNQAKTAQASLARLAEAAGQIQEDTRELIDHLLSVSLPSENFCTTLRRILVDFENQTGLAVHLDLVGEAAEEDCFEPAELPPPVAVQLVRISQEALTNVRKHARGAGQVSVELKNTDGQLLLTIRDDGSGFELADQRGNGKHFGLQVMRQRAARIGGQVTVDSISGKGTRVVVEVPLIPDTGRR
jgi:PAS domain S-box-containing protein